VGGWVGGWVTANTDALTKTYWLTPCAPPVGIQRTLRDWSIEKFTVETIVVVTHALQALKLFAGVWRSSDSWNGKGIAVYKLCEFDLYWSSVCLCFITSLIGMLLFYITLFICMFVFYITFARAICRVSSSSYAIFKNNIKSVVTACDEIISSFCSVTSFRRPISRRLRHGIAKIDTGFFNESNAEERWTAALHQ